MNYKHGDCNTRFYKIWAGLSGRCNDKSRKYYKDGISVDTKWEEYKCFKNDMYEAYILHCKLHGERNTTIDRINNKGNYILNNCKWSTYSEQAKNRNSNIILTYGDDTLCLSDMAKKYNINQKTFRLRLKSGRTVADIIENGKVDKKTTSKYEVNNILYTIKELSNKYNIKWSTLNNRIRRGWEIERALCTTVNIKGGR